MKVRDGVMEACDDVTGDYSWLTFVEEKLTQLGLGQMWFTEQVTDKKALTIMLSITTTTGFWYSPDLVIRPPLTVK